MARRWGKRLLVVAIVVSLLALLARWYDRSVMHRWVGSTDLEVEFVVVDVDTGEPVPGANIEVESWGGFYDENVYQEFTLITDNNGTAYKRCPGNRCVGSRSALRFTDTFVVYLPNWHYEIVADGYTPSGKVNLRNPQPTHPAARVGHGKAKVTILVHSSKILAVP